MSNANTEPAPQPRESLVPLALRGIIGGVMMGLANLVPGISGGTMLVATGIYTGFIDAIAELSTMRFRFRSMLVLGLVVASGFGAIVALSKPMAELVTNEPLVMFSLFIGLTLGGVPLVKRMLGKPTPGSWIAGVVTFIGMAGLAYFQSFASTGGAANDGFVFMLVAGLVAAAAMVLPGVSGGYMLLVLGVYVTILRGVGDAKDAVTAGDFAALGEPFMAVVLPVGIGVVVGVVGVSNMLKWLLHRYDKATLGALMGLLLGAVVGLWPFQQVVPADQIERIKGQAVQPVDGSLVYTESAEPVDVADLPRTPRLPTGVGEVGLSAALIFGGFASTMLLALVGRDRKDKAAQ